MTVNEYKFAGVPGTYQNAAHETGRDTYCLAHAPACVRP